MRDLAAADVDPLARLGRPPHVLKLFRSLKLVVVKLAGHDLSAGAE